jgi:hypothetical protein
MFASLNKLVGLRSAKDKGARSGQRSRAQLEVERLDERLLPSSVPNLAGVTMHFNNFNTGQSFGTTLLIQSVQDQGGGRGTFVGSFQDSRDGVSIPVSGTITFKGMALNPDPYGAWVGSSWYDFGVSFSGSRARVVGKVFTEDEACGSGDIYVTRVSGTASDYTNPFSPSFTPFDYFGTESDSHYISNPWYDNLWTESESVWAANWSPIG